MTNYNFQLLQNCLSMIYQTEFAKKLHFLFRRVHLLKQFCLSILKILVFTRICREIVNVAIYALYPESFCGKDLAIRKVFTFSDSACQVSLRRKLPCMSFPWSLKWTAHASWIGPSLSRITDQMYQMSLLLCMKFPLWRSLTFLWESEETFSHDSNYD